MRNQKRHLKMESFPYLTLRGCPALIGPKKGFSGELVWKGKKELSPVNFEVYFNVYLKCIKIFFQNETINFCKFISLFHERLPTAVSNRRERCSL